MRLSLEQPFLFANTVGDEIRLNQRHFEDKAL